MTPHTHTEYVEGCFRCDLNQDELDEMRHFHIAVEGRDCDGDTERTFVSRPTEGSDNGDELEHLVGLYLPLWGEQEIRVSVRPLGGLGNVHVSISHPTEEGFRNVEIWSCEDPDCDDQPTYRDLTAEGEGY